MRLFLMLTLLSLCLLALCVPAGNAEPAGRYCWVSAPPDQWALLDLARPQGQRQIGSWDIDSGTYTPLLFDKWLAPEEPPAGAGLPPGCKRRNPPTGVMMSKITGGDLVLRGGKEISKKKALELLGSPPVQHQGDKKVPDDKNKIRINIIGSKAATALPMAVAARHPDLVSVAYDPSAWMIQRQGFLVKSDPTVYIQAPDGAVLRRLEGYQGDAAFETVLQEVSRKIAPVPNYDGAKDEGWLPRLRPLIPSLSGGLPWIPLAIIGAGLAYCLWSRRKKI